MGPVGWVESLSLCCFLRQESLLHFDFAGPVDCKTASFLLFLCRSVCEILMPDTWTCDVQSKRNHLCLVWLPLVCMSHIPLSRIWYLKDRTTEKREKRKRLFAVYQPRCMSLFNWSKKHIKSYTFEFHIKRNKVYPKCTLQVKVLYDAKVYIKMSVYNCLQCWKDF